MSDEGKLNDNAKGGIVVLAVGGISIFAGFAFAVNMAKKSDTKAFLQGVAVPDCKQVESGSRFALRALGYGTLACVAGVSVLTLATCALLGINSMETFNDKMKRIIPQANKKPSQGRNDFKSIRELIDYITNEDQMKKDLEK